MKIVTIIGARPQFIKAATVSRAISRHNNSTNSSNSITEVIVHTGQHYDHNMSKIFFDELGIPEPEYNLDIGSDTHGRQTGKMLSSIEGVLEKEMPDWVLVYGDTNSTLAGALAASKLNIPVVHVEAGLRSFNRKMPEEINRIVADHLSAILFCPTETAAKNLQKEGFTNIVNDGKLIDENLSKNTLSASSFELLPSVLNVGDVMYDSVLYYSDKAENHSNIMKQFGIKPREYGLVTIHRAENTDDPIRLTRILEELKAVSKELLIIWPMHPRNKKFVNNLNLDIGHNRFRVVDPVGYLDFVHLEKKAGMIFTDSGGVQKEAYFFQVPCVTLRDETEWIETVQSGMNILAGANKNRIFEVFKKMCGKTAGIALGSFGDGFASRRIVDVLALGTKNEHQRSPKKI